MAGRSPFSYLASKNFHHVLGGAAGTLLGETSIMPKCPGNARFELQIGDVPHG